MNKATKSILTDLANIGFSVVNLEKPREAGAAEELRKNRIVYIESGNERTWVLKFGQAPFGHQPKEF